MYHPIEPTDHRSEALMQLIADKIDLSDAIIFTNEVIELPYRINGKQRLICLYTPQDIAAFAHHNYLISRYEKWGKGVRMYSIQILPEQDRRGYPFQYVKEVPVKRIPTLFSREEIKWMVARYEYDFGAIEDKWHDLFAPKGRVREMYPAGTDNGNTKRIA